MSTIQANRVTPKFPARIVEQLSDRIGVRLRGLDLLALDDQQVLGFATLVSSFCVVVVSDSGLRPPQQAEFARRIGELLIVPGVKRDETVPELLTLRTPANGSPGADYFHSDASFLPRPPSYSMLVGASIPIYGGNTMFSNQYAAWETLSPRLQDYLRDATVTHTATLLPNPEELSEPLPSHPLVRTHPLTGRVALYLTSLNRMQGIDGIPAEESRAVLEFLYTHSCQPENVYRHRWTQDDLVIWDNRCTMHSAVGDSVPSERILNRILVAGEQPR
jgi:taurine dioxygenase